MAVQVSYPGVYIEEFAPGAPIQGVGTSTGAFIGTALSGPIGRPTLIQSWDAFVATFGGFVATPPVSYLAPAVFGFFLNGGTTCYIVRVGTGAQASVPLDSRQGGGSPDPALVVRARVEGPAGNSTTAQVVNSSRLTALLAAAGSADTTLSARVDTADVTAMSGDRLELTVNTNAGFAPGDRILLTSGADTATAVIRSIVGSDTVVTNAPVPGTVDFAGGTVRTADLGPGQVTIRVTVPAGLRIGEALPRGALVSVTLDGTTEIRGVQSAAGDLITLSEGLANSYSLADDTNLPQVASLELNLNINDVGAGTSESFAQLSMDPRHPAYWGSVVSEIVALEEPSAPPAPAPADPRPVAQVYNLAGGVADDRATAIANLTADPNTTLDLLRPVDEVNMVAVPGVTDAGVQQAVIAHCRSMFDRFAILDSIPGATPETIRDQFADVRSDLGFAALYYPWIQSRNPLSGRTELLPPSGHMAGIYARTDQERGVFKAPANTEIRGAIGLERRLTDDEQGPLNLLGINCLRVFLGQAQPTVWGARTTALDRNWQYVNVRRLFLFLEESIEEGIRWAVFEPNNKQLWQKLNRTITEFLTRVWRDGALFGAKADEAFYVRIDDVLNPFSEQALGRLNIEIGVRPTYPAEFIIVRIGIWAGGSEVTEA